MSKEIIKLSEGLSEKEKKELHKIGSICIRNMRIIMGGYIQRCKNEKDYEMFKLSMESELTNYGENLIEFYEEGKDRR